MTFLKFIIFLSVIFVFWAFRQMYLLGKEDGYNLRCEEVNNHIDKYVNGTGWKV